jgi:hypothetical protein
VFSFIVFCAACLVLKCTKHKREHNSPNQTHMRIEKTYIFNIISNNRRWQFPRQKKKITPDDDHTG